MQGGTTTTTHPQATNSMHQVRCLTVKFTGFVNSWVTFVLLQSFAQYSADGSKTTEEMILDILHHPSCLWVLSTLNIIFTTSCSIVCCTNYERLYSIFLKLVLRIFPLKFIQLVLDFQECLFSILHFHLEQVYLILT